MKLWLILFALSSSLQAAVFQYALPVETSKGIRRAWLWVPPKAESIRGVVIGGMTLAERELARDPMIRARCREEKLAILFLNHGLRLAQPLELLDRFAAHTGFDDLRRAPFLFVGHSAGGPQAKRQAIAHADRCFGLIQFRGAGPGPRHDDDSWLPAHIPALMVVGQFDEFGNIGRNNEGSENWEKDRDQLVNFRRSDPAHLGSFAVEPGAGHFAWSKRCADLTGAFIAGAARARIVADGFSTVDIDPSAGWLSDPDLLNPERHVTAPWNQYTGDRTRASWHPDQAVAEANDRFHAGLRKTDQFLTWEDPFTVQSGARNFIRRPVWVGDGMTFELTPIYARTIPQKSGSRGAVWARAGEAVAHSDQPIHLKVVSGSLKKVGPRRLRIAHHALAPATEIKRVTFMAWSEGDETFRYTERVGMLDDGHLQMLEGKPQVLTFPTVEAPAQGKSVSLVATSDRDLPVAFHIGYGPAEVVNNQLRLAEVPQHGRGPFEIEIVAYQPGRALAPNVQRAEPVIQLLRVEP